MNKKRKKFDKTYIFPIIFIIFPLVLFLIASIIRYAKTENFNYFNNFIYLYDALKNYKEYIFSTIVFFTLGLTTIVFYKFFKKKTKIYTWIILNFIGVLIILLGNRILFVAINNLWSYGFFKFLLNGVNLYTFVLASEFCFLVSSLLAYFDLNYLKK